MTPKTLTFTVPGRPRPFMRHAGQGRRAYNPPEYSAWKEQVGWVARRAMSEAGLDLLAGDLAMVVEVRVPDKRYGDTDNYGKAIADALEGVAYENDRALCQVFVSRVIDPDNPGVTVTIAELGEGMVEAIKNELL